MEIAADTPQRPPAEPLRRLLPDGTPVLLAPIGPADADCLRAGFARLSPESRMRRFLHPKAALSEAELRYLTAVDQIDHLAWGARGPTDAPSGLGIARCVRLRDRPELAEVAVTVVDDWQGRGVGGLLLEALTAAARRQGIKRFVASAAAGNGRALALARHCGAVAARPSEGLVQLHLDLS